MARTLADLDDAADIAADHLDRGVDAPGRRAVSTADGSYRPAAAALDPIEVAAATLACLPDMTPRRLAGACSNAGADPVGALAGLERGLASAVLCERRVGRGAPGARRAGPHLAGGGAPATGSTSSWSRARTHVYVDGRPGYPIDGVPHRPAVLLAEGDVPEALARRRVAIVGTRAATPHGLADAYDLGAVLARAGVTVVSGLAIGIDAAAHEGALDAGGTVVGVLGTGLDVVYPRRHRTLFDRVRGSGLLVSELGYGVQPRRESFPGAQPHHRRARRARRGGRGHAEGRRPHHRRARARVRPHGDGVPGITPQPLGRGHQLAALRRRDASCSSRPTCWSSSSSTDPRRSSTSALPPIGDAAAVLAACHGEPATLDQLASRGGLSAVGGGRRGAGARAGRVDGTRPRIVLAAMNDEPATRR